MPDLDPTAPPPSPRRQEAVVAALIALAFAAYAAAVPRAHHVPDMHDFARWTLILLREGVAHMYGPGMDVNYPPLFPYGLYVFGKLVGGTQEAVVANVTRLRLVFLAFDLATSLIALRLIARAGVPPVRALLLALNLSFVYTSLVWGQMDAVYIAFAFASLAAAWERRPILSLVLLVLALNVKHQALLFAPFTLYLDGRELARSPRRIAGALVACAALQSLIVLPFLLEGNILTLRYIVTGTVGRYPYASWMADNLWSIVYLGADTSKIPDSAHLLGLEIRFWGAGLFLANAAALGWLLTGCVRKAPRDPRAAAAHAFLSMGLLGVAFFYFLTEAHERYIVHALPFLAVSAALRGRWLVYAVVSAGVLLNLEGCLRAAPFSDLLSPIYHPVLVSLVILCGYVLGVRELARFCLERQAGARRGQG